MLTLDAKIESILFYKGEPVSFKELAGILKEPNEKIKEAISVLRERLSTGGLSLIENEHEVGLYTSPDANILIEELRTEELSKELSKAALETISIILYGKNVSRSDIDFIRGVNSSYILRNLLVRGLVERKEHPEDSRKNIFIPTLELLAFMGVSEIKDLPDYENIKNALDQNKPETEKNEIEKPETEKFENENA